MTAGAHGAVTVEHLRRDDLAAAVDLLTQLGVHMAGTQFPAVYEAVLKDALRKRGVCVMVAKDGGRIAGLVVILFNPSAYWRALSKRRPLLAIRVLAERRRLAHEDAAKTGGKATTSPRVPFSPYVEPAAPPLPWSHTDPRVARVIFIGVGPEFRGRGIGKRLYDYAVDEMRARGSRALDASIDKTNVASFALHRSAGWKLYEDRPHIYAFREL